MVITRIQKFGTTLWQHKKKTLFGVAVLTWAGRWARRKQRNSAIRAEYAKAALTFGEVTISPEDRPRRLIVLANVNANERGCYDEFVTNALPLFHLAGMQVNVIKADSSAQLEKLAAAVDHEEADAVYIVGGDATIGRVITGMLRNRDSTVLPIGVYPGGYDNLTLRRLVPQVFDVDTDVRRQCESAMAVIEETKSVVHPFKVEVEGGDEQPLYSIGDVGAGWFRHIEDKRKKLWYFAGFKRRWAYIWEMLKHSPSEFDIAIDYEEYCPGCNKCRVSPPPPEITWRWWHMFTGTPRYVSTGPVARDYSNVINEKCGFKESLRAEGVELIVEPDQRMEDDAMALRLRVGGANAGRFGVISEGWNRCTDAIVHSSSTPNFYTSDLTGRAFTLTFARLPEFIRSLFVSSEAIPNAIEDGVTKIRLRTIDSKIELFLPHSLRFDAANF